MSSGPSPKDQFDICTKDCRGRCCRYITVTIGAPRSRDDWDEMRWWLAHEGISITKDEDGWLLHAETRCSNLRPDNACAIYPHHMDTCKEYDGATCEFTGPLDYDFEFTTEADLATYLERRKLKRGAEIAREIRKAGRVPQGGAANPLITLQGLPTA